jgi:SAM-dependent methyltransferase
LYFRMVFEKLRWSSEAFLRNSFMAVCFLCGEEMVPRFRARDHLRPQNSTEYLVEWCTPCEFGKIAGGFTPGDIAAFYTANYYTHAAPASASKSSMRLFDRIRTHLAWRMDRGIVLSPNEVARVRSAPTLCDVGCGSGQAMSQFKQAGYDAVGIEPDPAARSVATQFGVVLEGTAEALPVEVDERLFDLVLLSHVLEHCIDPGAALCNVKRLLAPGGTAIIEVPNNESVAFETYGPGWFFADIPRHLQFFSESSLRTALEIAGMRVTQVVYTGYTRQFSPQWLAAQREIRARIGLGSNGRGAGSAWGLLARTAFARDARKYDSIRVHAVHAG